MKHLAFLTAVALVLGACDPDRGSTADPTWTLYAEGGETQPRTRFETFDADHPRSSNQADCEHMQRVMVQRPDERRRFWCELGSYREKPL
jgi:hypothetical protein